MENKARLVVDLDTAMHTEIKVRASEHRLTIKEWVMHAIMKQIEFEKKFE